MSFIKKVGFLSFTILLATILLILLNEECTVAGQNYRVSNTPHAYYTLHDYTIEAGKLKEGKRGHTMVNYTDPDGRTTAPPFDPAKNVITLFMKDYEDGVKVDEWGFSPPPTATINYLDCNSPLSVQPTFYYDRPMGVKPPQPGDIFLFAHFFTPTVGRIPGTHERIFLEKKQAEKGADSDDKGKGVATTATTAASTAAHEHQPTAAAAGGRTAHVWALHTYSCDQLSRTHYKQLIRKIVAFISQEDLAPFPPGWLNTTMEVAKKRFDERLEAWKSKIQETKSSMDAAAAAQQPAKPKGFFAKAKEAIQRSLKRENFEHIVKSEAIGQRDLLHPEVLCNVDMATAKRMMNGERVSVGVPYKVSQVSKKARASSSKGSTKGSSAPWKELANLALSKRGERKSGGKSGGGESLEEEEPPSNIPPHILVQEGFSAGGSFGTVYKVHIRPAFFVNNDKGGEIRPDRSLGWLEKYRIPEKEDEFGPFALKFLKIDKKLDEKELDNLYNEAVISRAFDHPNLATTLAVCKPTENELALLSEFVSGGEVWDLISSKGFPRDGKLFEEANRFLWGEMVLALRELHSLGYAHRDFKMDNILWADKQLYPAHPRPLHFILTDYGTLAPLGQTEGVVPRGTIDYIAPELYNGLMEIKTKGLKNR